VEPGKIGLAATALIALRSTQSVSLVRGLSPATQDYFYYAGGRAIFLKYGNQMARQDAYHMARRCFTVP
jgi:hypothetical protein